MVVVRRRCGATTYISCVEWQKQGANLTVQSLELTPVSVAGRELGAEEALALRIERTDGTDLLILAPGEPGEKKADGVSTKADILFVGRRDGEISSIEHIELGD